MSTSDELFDLLDADGDGALSREDLFVAALREGWQRREAPLFAALDLLTVGEPLQRDAFTRRLAQLAGDPLGPFGEVLRHARRPELPAARGGERALVPGALLAPDDAREALPPLLRELLGAQHAERHVQVTAALAAPGVRRSARAAALLVIDPQRAFTEGVWMRSIGPGAAQDVAAIRLAFRNCGWLLRRCGAQLAVGVTRCPFPPESYVWGAEVAGAFPETQPYLIKPGNSALWPPTNGFVDWVAGLLRAGYHELVVAGCTLNSCVRVTALETQRTFGGRGLQVTVDLSLCGARVGNYAPSPLFGGACPVHAALRELHDAGVGLAERVVWTA